MSSTDKEAVHISKNFKTNELTIISLSCPKGLNLKRQSRFHLNDNENIQTLTVYEQTPTYTADPTTISRESKRGCDSLGPVSKSGPEQQ